MKTLVFSTVCAVLLSACASPIPKEKLSFSEYEQHGTGIGKIVKCASQGDMDKSVAEVAKTSIEEGLARKYDLDHKLLRQTINNELYYGDSPTKNECTEAELMFRKELRLTAQSNALRESREKAIQDFSNSMRVRSTYCDKFGSQISCRSY